MKHYKQSTKFTCAPSSLLMILNHYNKNFKLNQENEFEIWNHSAALPLRGSSLFGLALYASNYKTPVKVVVGNPKFKFPGYRFKAYKKQEIDHATQSSDFFYQKLKAKNIPVEKRNFTLTEVKQLLKQDKILLLRLIIGIIRDSKTNKRTSHYIPVTDYKNKTFTIFDPNRGKLKIPESKFQESFEKIKEVKRDNRMIVFG